MPHGSLTPWDSVSSPLNLGLMLGATRVFMPLIVFYMSWCDRAMRGKVTVAQIRANQQNADRSNEPRKARS
jgi:cytochrome d ubiquinol oxidase subunit II